MRRTLLATLVAAVTLPAQAAIDIQINYTGDAQYQAAFEAAASTWEGLLAGWQNGVVANAFNSGYAVGDTITTVFVDAQVAAIDGSGGVLGFAGPNAGFRDQLGFVLTSSGEMTFDSADVADLAAEGSFELVVRHELAHVLGFGTLWNANGVYDDGTGEFTGAAATAAWQAEFGQSGTPDVELGGGGGTANGHWNEVDGGGGLTGIVDAQGRDMRDELMTGWLNPGSFISQTTVASFVDIGFVAAPIPEPATYALFGLGALVIAARARRKA